MNLRLLPYSPERDAYRLLGLSPTATVEEIGVACRRLARAFHPDHNRSVRATEEMQVVNAVRRVMTDPETRATYDRERRRYQTDLRRPPEPIFDLARLADRQPRRVSAIERYVRAGLIGLRATAVGLLPPRCARCRCVISGVDAYCAACGTPLLTTGA